MQIPFYRRTTFHPSLPLRTITHICAGTTADMLIYEEWRRTCDQHNRECPKNRLFKEVPRRKLVTTKTTNPCSFSTSSSSTSISPSTSALHPLPHTNPASRWVSFPPRRCSRSRFRSKLQFVTPLYLLFPLARGWPSSRGSVKNLGGRRWLGRSRWRCYTLWPVRSRTSWMFLRYESPLSSLSYMRSRYLIFGFCSSTVQQSTLFPSPFNNPFITWYPSRSKSSVPQSTTTLTSTKESSLCPPPCRSPCRSHTSIINTITTNSPSLLGTALHHLASFPAGRFRRLVRTASLEKSNVAA